MSKIKVLIIDDSSLMRQLITEILSKDPGIEVVGVAPDPYIAKDKINKLNPDVLTLDVEMPRMDGLTFLEKLMAVRPMPVVMLSSLTEKGCDTTLRALELGAIDFITKPKLDVVDGVSHIAQEIIAKVKAAAEAHVARRIRPIGETHASPKKATITEALIRSTHKVIAIGTSTGGTEALMSVDVPMPPDSPGIVAVIHMPEKFTASYAQRLNERCQLHVKEAEDGDRILPGHVLLAPGGKHMEVYRSGAIYTTRIIDTPPVNRFKPSVDVLFHSMARYVGKNAVGAILTGMGYDGAKGMLEMKNKGASTIAQDKDSCVVFGMPKEAIALGAADEIASLNDIPRRLSQLGVSHTLSNS
ncbi:MAG: chemotaxis response regulator protein-glutamate methylesterase [Pirellulaceae bacterium]